MALATLSIDLEAKLAKLEEGMNRAAQVTAQNARKIQASFDNLNATAKSVGSTIGTALAAYLSIDYVRGIVKGIDALNDLKDATGASIENISALEDVAARTGTSFESVGATLVKFNKVLTDAKPGSEISNTLKSIGLDTEKLKQIDPAEALRQTAVALSGYADEGGKARFVQEAFGKSVKEAAPFLNDLATQGALVAKVTSEQAAEAEKFNQQLDSLAKNSKDSARSLISDLLPALNEILKSYIAFGGLKGTAAAVFGFDDLSIAAKKANELAAAVKLSSDRIDRMQEEFSRSGDGFLKTRIDKARERLAGLTAQALDASNALKTLANTKDPLPDDFSNEGRNAAKPKLKVVAETEKAKKQETDDATRALAQFVDQLDKQLEKEQELTETQKALNALQAAGKVGEIPQVRELVLNLAKKKEALDAELEITKGIAEFEKERAQNQREQDNTIDAASGRSLDQKKRELGERLDQRIKAGEVFSPEELDRIVKGIAGISTQVKETSTDIEEFTKSAAADIEGTLGSSIQSALRGDFDSIGALWKNMLINMAAQALQAQLGKALLGDAAKTGTLGGLSGAFVTWLKSADGNAFDGSGVMRFAAGDVFDSPHFFKFANGGAMQNGVLGEAGPEAVMPLKRGSDGRLGVAASGGRGPSIAFYYGDTNVGQGVSRGEVHAAMRQSQAETEARIRRLMRNGNL